MTPEDALIAKQDREAIWRAIERLGSRNGEVLCMYYGLIGEPMIFADIGRHFGFSQTRADQIVKKSVRKLGEWLWSEFPERSQAYRARRAAWHAEDRAKRQEVLHGDWRLWTWQHVYAHGRKMDNAFEAYRPASLQR